MYVIDDLLPQPNWPDGHAPKVPALIDDLERQEPRVPAVMLGDFNEWSLRGGSIREFGPGWQAIAPGKSFPSARPLAPLDRIATSHQWRCIDKGVHRSALATGASDHLPVWAEFSIREGGLHGPMADAGDGVKQR